MTSRPPLSDALLFQVFDVKRSRSEERKIKILEAFIDSIATRGFDHTSFESLGKTVGMQRTHVNYYFNSRDELMTTAIRYAVALGQQITIEHVQKATNWKDRLKAVVEGPFEWLERYPKHGAVMALFYYLCAYDPNYRKLQNLIREGGEKRIVACFQTLVETGKVSSKKAIEIARTIQSLMAGNIVNYFAADYPVSLKVVKANTVKLARELIERECE